VVAERTGVDDAVAPDDGEAPSDADDGAVSLATGDNERSAVALKSAELETDNAVVDDADGDAVKSPDTVAGALVVGGALCVAADEADAPAPLGVAAVESDTSALRETLGDAVGDLLTRADAVAAAGVALPGTEAVPHAVALAMALGGAVCEAQAVEVATPEGDDVCGAVSVATIEGDGERDAVVLMDGGTLAVAAISGEPVPRGEIEPAIVAPAEPLAAVDAVAGPIVPDSNAEGESVAGSDAVDCAEGDCETKPDAVLATAESVGAADGPPLGVTDAPDVALAS